MTCATNFWILIICIHTSRFGNRDKADLAAIVIHKPTHGIYFIPRFCPQNPASGATDRLPRPRTVRRYSEIWLRALIKKHINLLSKNTSSMTIKRKHTILFHSIYLIHAIWTCIVMHTTFTLQYEYKCNIFCFQCVFLSFCNFDVWF